MKLLEINTVCNGSTGKIMGDIARKAISNGDEVLCIYGRRKGFKDVPCIKIGGFFSFWYHVAITTLFDRHGHGSYFKTKKMINVIKKFNPDIIHLHNIHGYYLNYPLLFKFFKEDYKGKIVWTFHDCWPFTGHCPYFSLIKCNKWKTKCYHCPNKKQYPISYFADNSNKNFEEKKKAFLGLSNLTIITPSDWLNKLVKKSFMTEYKIITINNGIDFNIFKYCYDAFILDKYGIPHNKKIYLGVASVWDDRKGLDTFIRLSSELNENENFVVVGLNKKQKKKIRKYNNIIGILRTENVTDLVKLYSISTVFVNPSIEETFSLVTVEALRCNLPVVVGSNTPMEAFVDNESGVLFINKISMELIRKASLLEHKNFKNIEKYNKNDFLENIFRQY